MKNFSLPFVSQRDDPEDWCVDALAKTLSSHPFLILRQAWLPSPESNFLPARAWIASCHSRLFIFAQLEDAGICNAGTPDFDSFFRYADTFEIFLKHPDSDHYFEFHLSPDNVRLQLRWPHPRRPVDSSQRGYLEEFIIREPLFSSRTWLRPGSWSVAALIPWRVLSIDSGGIHQLRFALCRYDYSPGNPKPVLSSTSDHRGLPLSFHQLADWQTASFSGQSGTG